MDKESSFSPNSLSLSTLTELGWEKQKQELSFSFSLLKMEETEQSKWRKNTLLQYLQFIF